LAVLAAALGSVSLEAQEVDVAGLRATVAGHVVPTAPLTERPEWGSATYGVRSAHAMGFQPAQDNTEYAFTGIAHRVLSPGGLNPYFDFTFADLPAGALLTGLELEGCDSNPGAEVTVTLFRLAGMSISSLGSLTTGMAEVPGCGYFGSFSNLFGTGLVVDNLNFSYFVRVGLGATDPSTTFGAVRVYYRLQVSPAPATATFTDVPTTHPFFRFVEALVDAGITAGCGGGNYCVDTPITRGEMAVFLSVALGLHFPF
jgi:hypothetical protein